MLLQGTDTRRSSFGLTLLQPRECRVDLGPHWACPIRRGWVRASPSETRAPTADPELPPREMPLASSLGKQRVRRTGARRHSRWEYRKNKWPAPALDAARESNR